MFEESNGNVRFDLDPYVKVVEGRGFIIWPVAP